jgi:hypothetical protein
VIAFSKSRFTLASWSTTTTRTLPRGMGRAF